MVMLDQDLDRKMRDAIRIVLIFGLFTLGVLVTCLFDMSVPAIVFLAIQTVAIFVRVLNLASDLHSIRISQPRDH